MTTTPTLDRATLLAALDTIIDPRSGKGLAEAGLVRGLILAPGRAGFMLEVPAADIALYGPVRDAAEAMIATLPGVQRAQVVLTAEGPSQPSAPPPRPSGRGARLSEDPQATLKPSAEAVRPAHVKRVIAVASGKGGVGKSTVSVNLAAALAAQGLRVGLLDADVYGPSAPRMLGVNSEPVFGPEKKLIPLEAWGLKVMSIGFMVGEGSPMIWRGPMASSAVRQMMNDVAWGSQAEPLDIMVIDMPPGTGDIQLTLIQKFKLDGAIIVSTPQEIALIDARRAAAMFAKTGVPILGVVENMAYFPDPTTGARIPIFGDGGAKAEAVTLGVPLLGEIPIDMALRQACDDGKPVVAAAPESLAAQAFTAMAKLLA